MQAQTEPPSAIRRAASSILPWSGHLTLAAAVCAGASIGVDDGRTDGALAALAAILAALGGMSALLRQNRARGVPPASVRSRVVADIASKDPVPALLAEPDGRILHRNAAAADQLAAAETQPLETAFAQLLADPSAVLALLQRRANRDGAAQEDVIVDRTPFRISAHRISNGAVLWRTESLLPLATEIAAAAAEPLDAWPVAYLLAAAKSDAPPRTADTRVDAPLFEALPVALLEVSRDGRLLTANRRARHLLGAAHCTDHYLVDLIAGLVRPADDWLAEALAAETTPQPEVFRATRSEQETYLQITLAPVESAEDGRLLSVLHDATELKTLEAQFLQSQKIQAVGQLAGGVAHDFSNLLTAISGHCDLLLLHHDENAPDFGDLDQIRQNTDRAAVLVDQLLAFARKQQIHPERLEVGAALADVSSLLNRLVGETVALSMHAAPDPGSIRADKRQLEQVMMNLVINARDAMPEGGEIRIDVAPQRLAEQMRRDRLVVPAGDYVRITVSDTGSGIPADTVTHIFDPFFTTKRSGEGTGLGLSTVLGIVKLARGYVFCDSAPGSGTTFSLLFPAAVAPPIAAARRTAGAAAETGQTGQAGDATVLLVEDEASVRSFAARALRLHGYTVLEAGSAEEALAALADDSRTIDIFVTDVVMPGMDGAAWVREALQTRPRTPVIFMSGHTEGSFAPSLQDIPDAAFLAKPFSLKDLTDLVARQRA